MGFVGEKMFGWIFIFVDGMVGNIWIFRIGVVTNSCFDIKMLNVFSLLMCNI